MIEIERQNELIAQRIDQLATNIEQNNKQVEMNIQKNNQFLNDKIMSVLEISKESHHKLTDKVEDLQGTEKTLRDSLNTVLNKYFVQMQTKIGQEINNKTKRMVKEFSKEVNSIKDKADELVNMRIQTKKIEEISVSVVQVGVCVAMEPNHAISISGHDNLLLTATLADIKC